MELYIMVTRPLPPSPFTNSFRVKHPFQGPNRQGSGWNQLPKGICWNYNKDGFCRINSCKFLHRCAGRRGNHPLLKCSKKGQEQAQFNPSLNQTTYKLMPFTNSTVVTPVKLQNIKNSSRRSSVRKGALAG